MRPISIDKDLDEVIEIPVIKGDRRCFSAIYQGSPCFVKRFEVGAKAAYESELNAMLLLQGRDFVPLLYGYDDGRLAICTEWIEGRHACELVNHLDDAFLCYEMGRVYSAITTESKQVGRWHLRLLDEAYKTLKGECWSDGMESLYNDAKNVRYLRAATTHTDFHFENVLIRKDGAFIAVDFEGFGCDAPSITAIKVAFNPLFQHRRRIEQEMRLESFSKACQDRGLEIDGSEYPIAGAFWALTYAAYHLRNLGKYHVTRHSAVMPCREIYEYYSGGSFDE